MSNHWITRAACRGLPPNLMFATGGGQQKSKRICEHCLVRTECLAFALDERIEHGVWGGMTDRERRALLHRRPTVTSWSAALGAAAPQGD
ncbi:WhiB family transcriptional regulator [Streptomyces fructofermentans]|uniref:WhiB family transcriptional regulator n=1 Tax=Streptomyces fructofermentans TaxID=152141 RepID=UPI0033E39845